MAKPNLHVSIAILIHQNKVLVGWREANQHQGNKYEFPGGKVEANESPLNACRREVFEEVGLDLNHYSSFDFICHEYEDVVVNLHFFLAYVDHAQIARIQKPWAWYRREELQDLNFPKANASIIKRLSLKKSIKISSDLLHVQALDDNQYLYWRPEQSKNYSEAIAELNPNFLAQIIVNIEIWQQLSELQQKMIRIVQLKQHQLMQLTQKDLQLGITYIASCHDTESLAYAQHIGCEAAFLSPVCATQSHPEVAGMGWKAFAEMAHKSDLAIYALGGIKPSDLSIALQHYAHGIAGIRNM